ncbi:MAG: 3D domain-containing protein [Anaerohalosphaeraceae bacterium]
MSFTGKILITEKSRAYVLRIAVVATVATVVWMCAQMCMTAAGPILLSTRIPVEGQTISTLPDMQTVQPVTVEPSISLPEEIGQSEDQQLVDLLQNCSTADVPVPQWKTVRMRVTAYCACRRCCGKFSDGLTADLHKIRKGDMFVAADKRIPFGTDMIIPGYNHERPVEVKDRGRLIKGNRLDVFFNDHKVAKKWGTRYLDVLVKVEE